MESLADNNKFIDLLERFYDEVYSIETKEEPKEYKEEEKGFFNRLKKKNITESVKDIVSFSAETELKNYLDDILSNPNQSFWTLCQICQAIRWAEKVFLYKNNPDSILYVDSGLNEHGVRELLINTYTGEKIFIKLELRQKPIIKLTEQSFNQIITLLVTRDYGKKMENKYIIVDGEIDYDDDSDVYLINQVNKWINIAIRDSFNYIIDTIKGGKDIL